MKMLPNKFKTLRIQLVIGYFLILFILSIQAVNTYRNINNNKETGIWTKHTLNVIAVGHQLEKELLNMETGLRGYLITGRLNFLVPFEQGKTHFIKVYETTLGLVSDNIEQVRLLEKIRELQVQWLSLAAEPIIVERDKIILGQVTMQDISVLIASETGKQLMDQLRAKLLRFVANEEQLLKQRELMEFNNDAAVQNQIIWGSVLAILIAGILISLTIRAITRPIIEMTDLAKRIASGDLSQKIAQPGSDEIGDLARSINAMVDILNEISDQADAISNGDFSVEVKQKNDHDRLGIALNEMKKQIKDRTLAMQKSEQQMQRANESLQLQNTLKSQVSKITEITQGATHLPAVSDAIISALAKMTESGHGILYISDRKDVSGTAYMTLSLMASYAFDNRKGLLNEITLGEGLVGQCAKEKEQILITNAPEDYVQIYSGLGEKTPLNILVTPIIFEKKVMGVIELASFSAFSNAQREMLSQVTINIGAVFNNILNLEQTKKLLADTQNNSKLQ
ncbi:CHASE3 domain-containing protein [Psychromonas sp. Urea-02u-13]|uniref:CHASE3 domain-containing protein n=1 Tax=Psychromonas sp. Urea-02u-13 TaxID=2058326 RepID=UPI0018E31FDB|nr:CHASE3 domain-containing protein [Psychromonas sp. Urea-02u-13]